MNYKIRAARPDDAEAIHDIYGVYVEMENITFALVNPDVEEYRQKIIHTLEKYPYYVAEDENGEILGYVYASTMRPHEAYDWNVETTIALSPSAPRRQGIATALYNKLADTLEKQGYRYIYAVVVDTNLPSVALHEAVGFEKVAHFEKAAYKKGKWQGLYWMRKAIGNENEEPEPPVPFRLLNV